MTLSVSLDHEEFSLRPGRRTGVPILIAVHSTRLGPALGGCRVQHYPDPADAVVDVLRLSEAMSRKNAVLDVGLGGGKAVIAVPAGPAPTGRFRSALLLDFAERVNEFDGRYITAPDAGSTAADMATAAQASAHVCGAVMPDGQTGITTRGTIIGLAASIRAAIRSRLGRSSVDGCRIGILGLGGVGMGVAAVLASEGAVVSGFDTDDAKRVDLRARGGTWSDDPAALWADGDVFVPCALGGDIDDAFVTSAGVSIVCGAANNQLSQPSVDHALAATGITYVPDFVASGGGVLLASTVERQGMTLEAGEAVVTGIGQTVTDLLAATTDDHTVLDAANARINDRLTGPLH